MEFLPKHYKLIEYLKCINVLINSCLAVCIQDRFGLLLYLFLSFLNTLRLVSALSSSSKEFLFQCHNLHKLGQDSSPWVTGLAGTSGWEIQSPSVQGFNHRRVHPHLEWNWLWQFQLKYEIGCWKDSKKFSMWHFWVIKRSFLICSKHRDNKQRIKQYLSTSFRMSGGLWQICSGLPWQQVFYRHWILSLV